MWTIALLLVVAFVVGYGVAMYRNRKKIRVEFTVGPVMRK